MILTYWFSRLLIRIANVRRKTWGLVGAHEVSFLVLGIGSGLIRAELNVFDTWSPILFGVATALWLRYDLVRRQSA
ncbi:hypothetical protein [Brevundimonas goettingensis]|uniref:Uncharacterized protein n=1 Tax=Brevundimonas goettingensis TaxID=2774190 RepID=A0A975BZA6_9CAUL|nr:hypothetical protein [Brevundimonas goettingensis]QTC89804.1 hypothetical protein IFJ75_10850 [Brevundimonas goettingensis]